MATATPAAAKAAADHFPWDLLIPLLPQLIALLLVLALVSALGRKRILTLLRRVKKIGFAGFEIELGSDLQALSEERGVPPDQRQTSRATKAIEAAAELLSCAQMLWVDDNPAYNFREMRFLRRLCVQIDLATTTEEAEAAMAHKVYDVVISDMAREGRSDEGTRLVEIAAAAPVRPELVYYVMEPRRSPTGAVGLTNRPDQLVLLLIEALRRHRETPIHAMKGLEERAR